jgi:short-subunit dehydrogenase
MNMNNKTILITGASTGIGKETALHLNRLGFNVYAGVRKDQDAQTLKSESRGQLKPIFVDVADKVSITAAAETIAKDTNDGLYALVNNAGLSLNGPLEMLSYEDIQRIIQVNVVGLLAMTQAVLPMIRANNGRIINISSGHGLLAIPDKSVYAASKFAVQAISDSLRVELRPFGVSVSNIVVGKVETAVLGKILADREKMIANTPADIYEMYAPLVEYFDREVKNIPGIPALDVSKVIETSLTAENPKPQYLIGPGTKKMKTLSRFPTKLRDNMFYKAIYEAKK